MSDTIERLQKLGGSTAKAGIAEILRLDEIISRYAGNINELRAEIERLRPDSG